MHSHLAFLLGTLLALTLPTYLGAQGHDCELLPGAREASRTIRGGEEMLYISGPARFICPGEVILQADSAVGNAGRGEFELLGNVFYQDSVKVLTADWALYLRAEARLQARGDVVLTDRKSDSRIEGPELEYLQATESRPETETIVQGRPHAIFRQQRAPAGSTSDSLAVGGVQGTVQGGAPSDAPADSAAQPLEVDADLMRIFGESRFVALGRVEMKRGETRGSAREGEFDQVANTMFLTGSARLEGEGYILSGDRIEATLEGDELHEVTAKRDATLEAEDLDLQAPELRIFFADGEVERLVALGGAAQNDTAAAPAARPVVTSRDLRLTADSIDALAPGQKIERLIAVGAAYAVRAPDSLDIGLPEAIAYDWVVGDTITGYFAQMEGPAKEEALDRDGGLVPEPAPDSAAPKPRATLERLVAVGEGGGARSLYRIREKVHEHEPPSANYLVANRIVLLLREGEVREVEADGPIEGMHLQPAGAATRGGSTAEAGGEAPLPGSEVGRQR